jgi:hypothetical protein
VADQLVVDRVAHHDLTSVCHRRDPRCRIHDRPDVLNSPRHGVPHHLRSAEVNAHPHAQTPIHDSSGVGRAIAELLSSARVLEQGRRPVGRFEESLLHFAAPGQRVDRFLEGHAERALAAVAVSQEGHLVAPVPLERSTQDAIVQDGGIAHGCRVELPQGGGARDVREDDRHLALWRPHATSTGHCVGWRTVRR